MPLEQVGRCSRPDVATRNELIAAHLARLEEGLAQTQASVAALREMLQPPPTLPIEHRRQPAMDSAAIAEVVEHRRPGRVVQGALCELAPRSPPRA